MKAQQKAIETIKIKGMLELLIKTYGLERVKSVLRKLK